MTKLLSSMLWSTAILFLLGGGIYFTIHFRGIQFHLLEMIKSLKVKEKSKITPFQSLMMALAARIGVGSLAGIALAIYIGGPGAIFWVWIGALLTSVNAFVESCLGAIYREKDGENYKGGPAFYIDRGLHKKTLARIYALLIIIAYIVGFMTIQSNTIAKSLEDYFHITPFMTGIVLTILTAGVILKGIKGIINITSKLVPVMGLAYIILSFIILIMNFSQLPEVFSLIVTSAFTPKAVGGGVLSTFLIGLQRGVFSTEAGLGSGAIASSTSDLNNPVKLGLIQILGVHFTSFIICTSTALTILTSPYQQLQLADVNGIEITQFALKYHLGDIGIAILIFSIISFAFSTILAGYYYGESNLKYLKKKVSEKEIFLLKMVTLVLLLYGSFARASTLWSIVDVLVAIMAVINMYSILSLRREVFDEWKRVKRNKARSLSP